MYYKNALDKLREEVSTPVDPQPVKSTNGLVPQRTAPASLPPAGQVYDPTAQLRAWMQSIKTSDYEYRKKIKAPKSGPIPFVEGMDSDTKKPVVEPTDKKKSSVFQLDMGDSGVSLIRQAEGFRDTPYWDVNAYRAGYGSDTYTTADGEVKKVTPDSYVSKEDADRDLARRTAELNSKLSSTIGNKWDDLPEDARSALTSVAYNYGTLPKKVSFAARNGNLDTIAKAVESLQYDNDGINASRRMREAALIRGDDNDGVE